MGCGCGGGKASTPVTYEVVSPSGTREYRSPGQARAAAARDGGQAYRVQNGTRTAL